MGKEGAEGPAGEEQEPKGAADSLFRAVAEAVLRQVRLGRREPE